MGSISKIAGDGGCDLVTGSVTYTPSGRHAGKKIWAIAVHLTAQVTNFIYTPKRHGAVAVTVTADNWIGTSLVPTAATALIPLGEDATTITLASGTIFVYFR